MRTPGRAAEGDVAVVQAGDGSDRVGSAGAGAVLPVVPAAGLVAGLAVDGAGCGGVAEVQPVQMSAVQINAVQVSAARAGAAGRMPASYGLRTRWRRYRGRLPGMTGMVLPVWQGGTLVPGHSGLAGASRFREDFYTS